MNSKELSKYVGEKIKHYRKIEGITQKQLGEKLGVKHNTVSDYERGVISPEQDMLFAISEVFNVSINELFPQKENGTDELDRALKMTKGLELKDMNFLNRLIEKTLSMDEDERAKFLESIKFTVDYYEEMNKNN